MTNGLKALALVAAIGLAAVNADAAMRFGGGRNLGKQRPAPTAREAAPAPAPATPAGTTAAKPAPAAAAPTAAAPAAKPGFMSRWGGLLAGLGIGLLLSSLFGAQMGPIVGLMLAGLLAAVVAFAIMRMFAARNAPAAAPPRFEAIGGGVEAEPLTHTGELPLPTTPREPSAPQAMAQSEIAPFLRVAKTSFIRLQAANDAGDLDDIRDYTTPEMYAELAMQIKDRGDEKQRIEVVMVDAQLVESVIEGDYAIASVRFSGLIRENDARNPEPFDELWHVRKDLRQRNGTWLIAGIQQSEEAV
jgi:predicted lipid-binding transport protein (Tim44 family)